MKIGILGAGNVGGALGETWAKKGHEVFFGVRRPESAEAQAAVARCGARAKAGSPGEAVVFSDVVLNALPWAAAKGVLTALDFTGKILLDAINPLKPDLSGLEVGTTTSGGEQVAAWAKGARVVKIFNTTGANNMQNPVYAGGPIPMFYAGDDAAAKTVAAQLATDAGFEAVDAGPLENARLLEPVALLWIWLAYKGGLGREFALRIVKR